MSGSRKWDIRIADILDGIEAIEKAVAGMDQESFIGNRLVYRAVERELEIIGEAVRHLPEEYTVKHEGIPWADIRGMRNILAHEYIRVDLKIVWEVVSKRLPELKSALIKDDPRKKGD